jgi:hypothetical protein
MHDIYTKDRTALLFVDPYNDFLSDGGKLWPLVEGVASEVALRDGARLSRHAGEGRNCGVRQGKDACSARVERTKLRTCDPDDE